MTIYRSGVQPADRGPHAARRLISSARQFWLNLLEIGVKIQVKDKTRLDIWQYQHKSSSLNLFLNVSQPTSNRKCNVM